MIYWTLARPAWDEANPPDDFLSVEEKKRLSELRFQKRRTDWLRGRWTAKHLLLQADPACHSLPIQSIQVANEPEGAPYLLIDGSQRYRRTLSISHCGPYALCALSDSRMGCDLEHIERRPDIFIEDFFTRPEVQHVHESSETAAAGPGKFDLEHEGSRAEKYRQGSAHGYTHGGGRSAP